jgi:hypothetical protein
MEYISKDNKQPPVRRPMVKKEMYQTSGMVGLPKEVQSRNEAITKAGSTGPKYKEIKKGVFISNSTPLKQNKMKATAAKKENGYMVKGSYPSQQKKESPMKQKTTKKIVEKGSYENGKVEKYASKTAMMKHEKKETKPFEKKEMKKSPPVKMKKC